MNQYQSPEAANYHSNGNKALTKGLLTGGLILLMLIPTFFISNLVDEREQRQHAVVKDVSSKWAFTSPAQFVMIVD